MSTSRPEEAKHPDGIRTESIRPESKAISSFDNAGTNVDEDVIIINWDGPNDPENPKNWPYRTKMIATIMVSLFTLVSPVSSSMISPATPQIAKEFGIRSSVVAEMITSIFVLAYAIGPFINGPLSEMFGRSRVIQGTNLFYLVFNLACGFARTDVQLIVFRFFAGLGGSSPQSVGGGVLSDIWKTEERGRAVAIYSAAPLLGPVVGPIAGAWVAQRTSWRWVFWSTSIFTVLVQVMGFFLLKESYPPLLLKRRAKKIRKEMDLEKGATKTVRTVFETKKRSSTELVLSNLVRPFAILFLEPIAQVVSVYMALVYGVFYLFLTSLTRIFSDIYQESTGIAGLNYIALGLGISICSQVNARFMDKIYIRLKEKRNGRGQPEFRVPSMIPGSIILPAGLFLVGWSAEKHLHWIAVDIGITLIGGSMILTFQSMQAYLIDCFKIYAASALAATTCLRALAGFTFPLFAPKMFESLGYGKGLSILAGISIAVGWPAPVMFWLYGGKLRQMSKYMREQKK